MRGHNSHMRGLVMKKDKEMQRMWGDHEHKWEDDKVRDLSK